MGEPGSIDPFLGALAEHWDELVERADDSRRRALREVLEKAAGGADPRDVKADLADLVFELLPPGHPVVAIMGTTTMSNRGGTVAPVDLDASVAHLIALVGPLDVSWPDGEGDRRVEPGAAGSARSGPDLPGADPLDRSPLEGSPLDGGPLDEDWADDPSEWSPWDDDLGSAADDELDVEVRSRLLALPRLSAGQVLANDVDPHRPELIRLTDAEGEVWFPRFQFDDRGSPMPVILEINDLLGASDDPWGMTCWWVDPHARLAAVPTDLLGRDEDLLRLAARAMLED